MNQKTFWPSVYKVNVNRYPELIQMFGNANNVMKAEKKAIWDALHYDDECKLIAAKQGSKCRGKLEDRHRRLSDNSFAKKTAFKTCKYKANGQCVGANVKLDQSLQFLRWLLFSVDPKSFYEYVHQFPHQLTEKNYGYNIEEQEQYIPEPVVEELQAVYVNADLEVLPEIIQHQIESVSPIGVAQYAKRATAIRRISPPRHASPKRASPKRSDGRLKECMAHSKRLEEKLKEHSLEAGELARTLEQNRTLNRELKTARKELADTIGERDELDKAYKEAEKYAQDCAKLRAELKDVRKEMDNLSKQPKPSESDIKHAFAIMTKKIGVAMTNRAITGKQEYITVANNVKQDFIRVKKIVEDSDRSTGEHASELIKFYIDLFDTTTGYLSEL